jgi:hypothetical protein
VLLNTRSIGTIPFEYPFVPLMCDPWRGCVYEADAPAHFEMVAQSLKRVVDSVYAVLLHGEEVAGRQLSAPSGVEQGVAWVKYLFDIRLYVSIARSKSVP